MQCDIVAAIEGRSIVGAEGIRPPPPTIITVDFINAVIVGVVSVIINIICAVIFVTREAIKSFAQTLSAS